MSGYAFVFEARFVCGSGCRGSACGGFAQVYGCIHHGLGAPGEAVDAAHASALLAGLVFVEGCVNAAQNCIEGNAGVAPGLDECPVERGEQQDGAAALLEALFDLSEVVEVVAQGGASRQTERRTAHAWRSPTLASVRGVWLRCVSLPVLISWVRPRGRTLRLRSKRMRRPSRVSISSISWI